MRRLRTFMAWPAARRRLMLEALFFLAWARFLKALPFKRIAPKLGRPMSETPHVHDLPAERVVRSISEAVRVMSCHTFWESKCLVQALAAKKMLERRSMDSTLYLGTAKDKQGNLIAHAWLRSGPVYLTGGGERRMFTTVAVFGKDYSTEKIEGERHEPSARA
ncbi:lasso peptide biosynthesis B2 protein [Cohnella nanjingensis]|uniref:Lasso peptide biosynthesis B2 protein n=1 Tax=Cohnella nanjingensis TaxID=1387779 RepID=A0A7X0RPR5_9BACL|nr:lasso peptide biosynthesis B2 protein [Cohnella nanjingensis]MBB6671457.1 lasso peptide biosynthesis B2 protein [Cohnella nanjingensis]